MKLLTHYGIAAAILIIALWGISCIGTQARSQQQYNAVMMALAGKP